jgi:hypothetical protein
MSMFIQTVGQLNKRGSVNELDEALSKAVQQVRATGKSAELTYKLKIKPQDTEGDTVQIEDSITLKTANPMRKSALFFTTEDGRVSRENPAQPDLPMETIQGGKTTPQPQPVAAAQ